jgi:hypothetical protein
MHDGECVVVDAEDDIVAARTAADDGRAMAGENVTGANLALQFGDQSIGHLGGGRLPGFKGHRQL